MPASRTLAVFAVFAVFGRFVLGRYRRVASAEEKRAFLSVFEDLIVKRYLPLFVEISTATLDIGPVNANRNNPRFVSFASQIRGLKREPGRVRRARDTAGGRGAATPAVVRRLAQ